MLLAEIHGHRIPEVSNSEDYLTSAVFGHLRYLPPSIFWHQLFAYALSMPGVSDATLAENLDRRGIDITQFRVIEACFWAMHSLYGCPDLILVFKGSTLEPLVIVIEAKLWSQKSGTGEFDQIARYLHLLDDASTINPRLPDAFSSALIYLTEHDSVAELEESVEAFGEAGKARKRIFRLQWQDIALAAKESSRQAAGAERLILEDIAKFLSRRNLEYFTGFRSTVLPDIQVQRLHAFSDALFAWVALPAEFGSRRLIDLGERDLFTPVPLWANLEVKRGSWIC